MRGPGLANHSASIAMELEIIACSVEDAIAAHEGGAGRLEITVQLSQSGLTPPFEMVREILRRTPLPARVMIRERDDFNLQGPEELKILKAHAQAFASLPVEGLVTGYVKNGSLDLDALNGVIAAAPSLRFTVHNAIEQTSDPIQALREVRSCANVDRALVHGGSYRPLEERIARLREYGLALGPGRNLIIGGGLTLETLSAFRREPSFHIFHLGRAVRTPEEPSGKVDAKKVRKAMELLRA